VPTWEGLDLRKGGSTFLDPGLVCRGRPEFDDAVLMLVGEDMGSQ